MLLEPNDGALYLQPKHSLILVQLREIMAKNDLAATHRGRGLGYFSVYLLGVLTPILIVAVMRWRHAKPAPKFPVADDGWTIIN